MSIRLYEESPAEICVGRSACHIAEYSKAVHAVFECRAQLLWRIQIIHGLSRVEDVLPIVSC